MENAESKPEEEIVEWTVDKLAVRRSNKVDALVAALIAAQLEYDTVTKDAENPAYKRGEKVSKYATLDSAVTATRPHLNKHGLTIIQHLTSDNRSKELTVTTSLYHISEQFFESDLSLPSVGQGNRFDPQTLASASTYGRRITWLAIAGAAPADDDDGNKASDIGSREAAQAKGQEKIAEIKEKMAQKPAQAPAKASVAGDIDALAGLLVSAKQKQTKQGKPYVELEIADFFGTPYKVSSFDNFTLSDGKLHDFLLKSDLDVPIDVSVEVKTVNGKDYRNLIDIKRLGDHNWEYKEGVRQV